MPGEVAYSISNVRETVKVLIALINIRTQEKNSTSK